MSKQITIMANSRRDQEGYSDTQMGVSLDIECDLSDVGFFLVNLRKLDKEFKSLYPQYESSEISINTADRTGTDCHIFYRYDFSHIKTVPGTIAHNISSLMSAYTSFRVSQSFREFDYEIVDDYKINRSDKEIAISVCKDQFDSFLWYISDTIYEVTNFVDYDGKNQDAFLKQLENDIVFKESMEILNTEFDLNLPENQEIPFIDYNPLTASKKRSQFISDSCSRIKYSELLQFFYKNIK